jgi:phospholipase/carboxylesterase
VVAPRGPLQLPGSPGYHWYRVPRVGYPDPVTFAAAREALAELHDEVSARTGIPLARTVLGGFSMGTVMSYALGLDGDRPAPAGLLAFSGFIPTVEGWRPALEDRASMRVFIAHGRRDPVIDVSFARTARQLLEDAGLEVDYRESEAAHNIDPADVARAGSWLLGTVPA